MSLSYDMGMRFRVHTPLDFAYFTQVVDSKGHTLFRKEDVTKGKFAFTTEDYEVFDVCFLTHTNGELWQARLYVRVHVYATPS